MILIIIYSFYFAITFSKPITGNTEFKPFRIHLQTATANELELLPGVGPKIAQRIIEYRREHDLKTPDDLTGVHGIGELTVDRLEYLIAEDDDLR